MEDRPGSSTKTGRLWKLLLRVAITAACIWYVSGKIDFARTGEAIKNADLTHLILALLAFVISKLIASVRLNLYFRNIGINMPERINRKLYWLGMFYNLFSPGAVGGDAYKVIVLSKKYSIPYKKTIAAVLLDRVTGLIGLGLILAAYGIFVLSEAPLLLLLITAAGSVGVFYWVVRKWFKDFLGSFLPTLVLGVLVQLSQVVCAYLIIFAMGITHDQTEYIFLFLISSVVALLPLTISGLGARELVFLEGSKHFGFSKEVSVVISLIFYVITLLVSAVGAIYVFRDPLKKERTHE